VFRWTNISNWRKAAELAQGKVDAVRVRLRSLRTAKRRKKDSHDLHKLQNALNGLGEEMATITYAGETGKEQTPGPEAVAAYQERYRRLETIREKLAELAHVMDSVDDKLRGSPSRANAHSDIGKALQFSSFNQAVRVLRCWGARTRKLPSRLGHPPAQHGLRFARTSRKTILQALDSSGFLDVSW